MLFADFIAVPQSLSDSRLANLGAIALRDSFEEYHHAFKAVTRRAKTRFEQSDWQGNLADSQERLELRAKVLARLVQTIHELLETRLRDYTVWVGIKAVYSGLIANRDDWEIAETFYNSVTRRIFATVGVNAHIEFVDTDFDAPPTHARAPILRGYAQASSTAALVEHILRDFAFGVPYQNVARDAARVAAQVEQELRALRAPLMITRAQIVTQIFYRGRRAYLVGKIYAGAHTLPLILTLQNEGQGIYVDAALLDEDDVSILFSFTRSYFFVEADRPYDLARFLQSLMPRKRVAELYISIGYHKHGKTELYRDFLRHLEQSDDKFEIAPGERGMVMLVFHLPSYEAVFKIIKDNFDEPKKTTRAEVKAKYNLVFRHDRAGRLVDAQEYEHLAFDRARFDDALLQEMLMKAGETVRVENDHVVISHLYVERRLEPLNLFVKYADDNAVRRAVTDYGYAIKDLAKANIFPGDILLKNFGVTRHGRVISYDYDELCLITALHFRRLPLPRDEDDEFANEAWFYVGENDFFPEEFGKWLGLAPQWKQVFLERHADLFDTPFWDDVQTRLRAGEVIDILPYAESKRLRGSVE
ncbi:MAG: bifunctional isocitrate dehydrogenase kinase/phosphatase [Chloroflexi bacterium UTCFX4]|jgi:isocitrate dehydrogenase kinase/phosphatase|nr:MAG: bifunctional isocitrate dehydrogenase kinase/phosphatase [Chloroflexi bacterium UTCFX4]